jgi:hypothetical protein
MVGLSLLKGINCDQKNQIKSQVFFDPQTNHHYAQRSCCLVPRLQTSAMSESLNTTLGLGTGAKVQSRDAFSFERQRRAARKRH